MSKDSIFSAFLCFFGLHSYRCTGYESRFAHCKNPENENRPVAMLWLCRRCNHHDWKWYEWATKAGKEQGGSL